jgi:hypothetical protein
MKKSPPYVVEVNGYGVHCGLQKVSPWFIEIINFIWKSLFPYAMPMLESILNEIGPINNPETVRQSLAPLDIQASLFEYLRVYLARATLYLRPLCIGGTSGFAVGTTMAAVCDVDIGYGALMGFLGVAGVYYLVLGAQLYRAIKAKNEV